MESDIYNRISQLRKIKDLTKKDFALKTGVSEASIKKYEAGDSMPGGDFFLGLAKSFLDVNIRWLLTGQGDIFLPIEESPDLESRVKELEKKVEKLIKNAGE